MMRVQLTLILIFFGGFVATATETLSKLNDEYLNAHLKAFPNSATSAGVHDYDADLVSYSKETIKTRIEALKNFSKRYDSISKKGLKKTSLLDWKLAKHHLQSQLLELEEVRMWEKNPDFYSSLVSEAVYVLMVRNFAPIETRLKAAISREKQSWRLLEEGKANLKRPPRIYTQVALEQLPGIISFFEKDVPLAFAGSKNLALLREFKKVNEKTIEALKSYQIFLKDKLLPQSDGDFRLGEELYRKKLAAEEMVDDPLDDLLKRGTEDLKRNQKMFSELAEKSFPGKTALEALKLLEADHPKPENTLAVVREDLKELQDFLEEHHIVTLPKKILPIVQETPPFLRALTMASMDTPGPFEAKATEAYYNVTLPEPQWSAPQVEEHMGGLNTALLSIVSIHEAFPGHYVQFLWVPKAPSKVRKLLGANTNVEGWAHYCEQMLLDEGYHKEDGKIRLGQLQDALLRNARFIVGIEMHRGRMTFEEGIRFFQSEGYQTHSNAERETKRGTMDPTYLYYTLGKLEILKLREDYKKFKGEKFSLKEFHDSILKQGFPPIPILREELLGGGMAG